MKVLLYVMAFVMLDAIIPRSCRPEPYNRPDYYEDDTLYFEEDSLYYEDNGQYDSDSIEFEPDSIEAAE